MLPPPPPPPPPFDGGAGSTASVGGILIPTGSAGVIVIGGSGTGNGFITSTGGSSLGGGGSIGVSCIFSTSSNVALIFWGLYTFLLIVVGVPNTSKLFLISFLISVIANSFGNDLTVMFLLFKNEEFASIHSNKIVWISFVNVWKSYCSQASNLIFEFCPKLDSFIL